MQVDCSPLTVQFTYDGPATQHEPSHQEGIRKLQGREFRAQRVVITNDVIALGSAVHHVDMPQMPCKRRYLGSTASPSLPENSEPE